MDIQLRGYQESMIEGARAELNAGRRSVLIQAETGAGKTIVSGFMLRGLVQRARRGLFICNRKELVDQTEETYDKLGIQSGIIAAGRTPDARPLIQIASIDTLRNRLEKLEEPDLVIWDECRSMAAAGWFKVFNAFPNARHIGLDATPIRLDGRGLGDYFEAMVCGPKYSELISVGALVPFDSYSHEIPGLDTIRTRMGEFDQAQLADMVDTAGLVGDVVAHHKLHAAGKLTLTFGVNVAHSQHLAEQYRLSGISAAHVDGRTEKTERARIIAAFRRREIQVLCNVDLFTAGFDVPIVECVTLCRPTKSLAVFKQQCGRGSRPAPGKGRCLLLDHAGNVLRHGLPDEDREWDLTMSKQKTGDSGMPVRQCESCYFVYPITERACPACGAEVEFKERERSTPEVTEGTLKKLSREEIKAIRDLEKAEKAEEGKRRRIEVAKAKDLDALLAIQQDRGYASGWALNIWNARGGHARTSRAEAQFEAYMR